MTESREFEIGDLVADPLNRRRHPDANLHMIQESLHEVGTARSIVIDEHGEVLAGNGVLEAAKSAGITKVLTVDTDGKTLVAVRRTGLSDQEKYKLALYDNRTAELAEWDPEQLRRDIESGLDLSMFFSPEDLSGLIDPPLGETKDTGDRSIPDRRETTISRGDCFSCGPHRVMCGDSTNAHDVDRLLEGAAVDLMWTDPPYGVSYQGKTAEKLRIEHDYPEDLSALLRDVCAQCDRVMRAGASFYLCHGSGANSLIAGRAIQGVGWHFHQTLVWVKNHMVLGHSDYHYQHEPIIYGWKPGADHSWYADRSQVSVFHIDRPSSSVDHPTMKPLDLVSSHVRNSSAPGSVVYDPFAGSGTTMAACQHLGGRRCYSMEIDPVYCQVIVDQWDGETVLTV